MIKQETLIILTPGFPANEADCTCLPPRQLFVRTLKKNNPLLCIVVLAFQYPFMKSCYSWNGVEVISFNGRNRGKFRRLMLWQKVWTTLKGIRRQANIIGILNFWLGECALVGHYFAKRYRIKQYTWMLGQDAKVANRYHRYIKPQPDNLIALSDFIANEYSKNYNAVPHHIIPVGIDTSLFDDTYLERASSHYINISF